MKKLFVLLLMIAPMASFAQKFGHVNVQEIMQAMPELTKARADLEALAKQYEADLKSMQEEIQKKAEAYEKEQASLPANIKERREKELQDMYQKINDIEPPTLTAVCPDCGATFEVPLNFTGEG